MKIYIIAGEASGDLHGSNLIKAYLAAAILLFLFHMMVTRHLRRIADQLNAESDPRRQQPLTLNRPASARPDELDQIVTAYNSAQQRLELSVSELEEEVASRKKAEAEANRAAEARKTFLANMSHEIRTPLNAIMGLFQLLIMADIPARQKKQAEVGLSASQRLLDQLVNVLEIVRIEGNALKIQPKPTELRALALQWKEIATANKHRLGRDEVEVELVYDDNLPHSVQLDPRRVTQIVSNLLDNAMKFTLNGKIRISVRLLPEPGGQSRKVQVSVADTGRGVPPEQLEVIFDRFAQVETGPTRAHSGIGLGLAICRELADMMNGQLTVNSPSLCGCYRTEFNLVLNELERVQEEIA